MGLATEYRGIKFKVVPTRSQAGWMWIVEVSQTQKIVGTDHDRDGAIRRAKNLIDEVIDKPKQNGG